MAKIYILIALLPQLFYTLVHGQESPCPQYFTYIVKPGTDETIGRIEVQSSPKSELRLKVTVSIAAELPTSYVGRLELARSKEESAEAVRQGRNLLYNLYFPLRDPRPKLTGIWFNDKQYCSGPSATGNFVTTITLEHTLIVPNALSQSGQPSNLFHQNLEPQHTDTHSSGYWNNLFLNEVSKKQPSPFGNNIFLNPALTPTPTPMPTPVPTTKSITVAPPDNNNECGRRALKFTNLLIAQGRPTSPGEWPWLVAIFVVKNGYDFQCAGTILTNKHVLTAAHCVMLNRTHTIHPNVLVVALGRFNLHQFRERGTVNRDVASHIIHHDYSYALSGDSDIAVLTLRRTVEFSPFIKPICLWSGSTNLQNVISRTGFVVGWGRDQYGNPWTEDPRMAMMPIVSLDTCHKSYSGFASLTSDRTFCAGTRDGSGPCNGDSGSGLVLYDSITGRYQLRGVVSLSVLGNEPLCDLSKYVVFVDVAQYLPWIQQQIAT